MLWTVCVALLVVWCVCHFVCFAVCVVGCALVVLCVFSVLVCLSLRCAKVNVYYEWALRVLLWALCHVHCLVYSSCCVLILWFVVYDVCGVLCGCDLRG